MCFIGFHLSATLTPPAVIANKGSFQVAVVFDRRRISSCTCTCNGASWCSHVVALCLYRIHQVVYLFSDIIYNKFKV